MIVSIKEKKDLKEIATALLTLKRLENNVI